LGTLGVTHANIVVVSAFAYGGLVQLLARMWPVTYLLPRKFFIIG
jgi:succinate-acetate transporter protein